MNRMLHYWMRGTGNSLLEASPTDQQLLERYLDSRDEAAFSELVHRHELPVLKACRQVLRSAADVDDAFQATFLVLLRRGREVRWQPSLRGWLVAVAHRIAVRLAVTQQRTQQREKLTVPTPSTTTPLADVSMREACSILHEEMNRLPDSFRLPLLLCYLQGYSRDEAAEMLGWSLGSVKAGLERGRQRLKQRLERRGVTLTAGLLTLLARPLVSEAIMVSPAARTVQSLMGSASARVISLSRGTGVAGWSIGSRGALCLLVLLLGTASGLTLAWAKGPTDPPAAVAASSPIATLQADDPESVTVSGEVLDPQGKPVAGANIGVMKYGNFQAARKNPPKLTVEATTDASGKFQLVVKQDSFYVVAEKSGYGLDAELITSEKSKKPVQLHLRELVNIEGTVVDEVGKPVADALVECQYINRFAPQVLEDKLLLIKQSGNTEVLHQEPSPYFNMPCPSTINRTAQSDAQGRFTLPGMPAGMIAVIDIKKAKQAGKMLQVILLPGFADQGTSRHRLTAEAIDAGIKARYQGSERTFEAPRLQLTMVPGIIVEGTVTNERGEPVAGTPLAVRNDRGRSTDGVTDAQGRYRVSEVSPGESYSVHSYGPANYMLAMGSAVHRNNGPIRIDLKLRRGTVLTGKVIDAKTGLGVRSWIQVKPTPGNPLLNKAGINLETSDTSQADGTFRLVAPPGDVLVSATAAPVKSTSEPVPYQPAKILETDYNLLQKVSDPGASGAAHFRGDTATFQLGHAYQLLDLPADRETSIELTLVRGKERTIHLVDSKGQPVTTAIVMGLDQKMTPYQVKQSSLSMVGIQSEEGVRPLFVISREKHLGAYLMVPTTTLEPLTVTLQPLGSITGRLIDNNDKPVPQIQIGMKLSLPSEQAGTNTSRLRLSYDFRNNGLDQLYPVVFTDEEGRFSIAYVIPGMKFQLSHWNNQGIRRSSRFFSTIYELKPGQQLNLGESMLNAR